MTALAQVASEAAEQSHRGSASCPGGSWSITYGPLSRVTPDLHSLVSHPLTYTIKNVQLGTYKCIIRCACVCACVFTSSSYAFNTASTSFSANCPSSLCLPHFDRVLLSNWAIVILFCLFPSSVPKYSLAAIMWYHSCLSRQVHEFFESTFTAWACEIPCTRRAFLPYAAAYQ